MGKFTFKKEERLTREKWIQELFQKGSSFVLYPFKVLFLPHPDPTWPVTQVLITVSNRSFSRAVDRNTIKRRVREAYRLHKFEIGSPTKWVIAYIYIGKEIAPSDVIHHKLVQTFDRLRRKSQDEKN